MDFLQQDPWLSAGKKNIATATVMHLGPGKFVILPGEPIPDYLREQLESVRKNNFAQGMSATAVALNAGLQPESALTLAALGKKMGLWNTWPEYHSPLWKYDMGHLPVLQ